jgi:hypothetical protein
LLKPNLDKKSFFFYFQRRRDTALHMYVKSGADVMVTIFSDFSQFSATKLALFKKKHWRDHFFASTSSILSQKRQFFGENIFKITTSVPGHLSNS